MRSKYNIPRTVRAFLTCPFIPYTPPHAISQQKLHRIFSKHEICRNILITFLQMVEKMLLVVDIYNSYIASALKKNDTRFLTKRDLVCMGSDKFYLINLLLFYSKNQIVTKAAFNKSLQKLKKMRDLIMVIYFCLLL